MVDITAKLFWYRSKEWYQIMADKLTDFVYTDESKETIDVINLLLLGWILLGLIVYIVGNIVASYLRKRQSTIPVPKHETADEILKTKEHVSSESEVKSNLEDILRDQEIPKKSYEIPVCEGDDQEVAEWINNVFSWIYKQRVISPVIDAWISALNARTRLSSTEHGILVDFKDLHAVNPPRITEVRQSSNYKSDINLGAEMEVEDLSFEVVVTQFKEKDKIIVPFNLNVQRMIGRVVIECTPEDLTFVVKYSETPQIQLSSELSKDHEMSPEDCQPLSDLVNEITVEALSSVIVPLRFNCFPACPRLLLKTHSEDDVFEAAEEETEKQLLVKIIKASKLGGSKGCSKPYCVVEMDEPPQKFETKVADGTDSPFWDESFKFIVKDSAELLFEIYDKDKPSTDNFLGLGIVGMDELEKNPSQRQIIPLQSRPLEEDDVTGSLTAEFVFLNQSTPVVETTHLAQHITKENGYSNSGKTVETNSRVTAGGTVITTTTIKRTKEEPSNRLEPKHDLNAYSNSVHSADPNLHKVEEVLDQNKRENTPNAFSEQLAKNGDCKLLNGTLAKSDLANVSVLPQSDSNKILDSNYVPLIETDKNQKKSASFEENSVLSPHVDSKLKFESLEAEDLSQEPSDLSKIISESTGANSLQLIEPGLKHIKAEISEMQHENTNIPDPAYSLPLNINENVELVDVHVLENKPKLENSHEAVHVHVLPPIPTLVIEAPLNNESNEIIENKSHDFKDPDSEIASLPSIAESDEVSSLPSNGIEKAKDAETDVPGTALKELEKHSTPTATSKSTLIIHSVQRPENSVSESLEASPASHASKDSHTSYSESAPTSPSLGKANGDRSRPKEKKTLMGTLRRRLSFHKNRSKSAENRFESASSYSQASSRSTSADRGRQPSAQKLSPFKGKFLGQFLTVPGSTRSSLSEASGISASSTRTYINENSTLVIETNENGIIKRYLIPNSLVHRSKWKKRGTKLHIFNDHVFLAKHLSGSTTCQVCQKQLTRRPGKQGYECRGCNLQCHKSCHVKVESYCSNSTINSMEVEYIHDPKGASPKSI
ncbi:uncharacterized protein LOC129990825 isoform X1 [Argiope bruennichi]|uniref:uncharacterized protein LOC129990825 isoform X1 n=1 Tax=Argiope bruennichi TaxID=94029 RepID=UPI002494BA98|nr:uncharacterized protein LOC129990825 isoform X1 [Argiope bruennichi]